MYIVKYTKKKRVASCHQTFKFSLRSKTKRIFPHFFASLRFSNFCFEAKQSEAKFKPIFSLSLLFFHFFSLFFVFFVFFTFLRLIFVSLRFFHLIFAYFTFVFASDFWCFASKWIVWNQAFFSLPSETKFSLQFQISLPKRKWGRTLARTYAAKVSPQELQLIAVRERAMDILFNVHYGPAWLKSHFSGRVITPWSPCLLPATDSRGF